MAKLTQSRVYVWMVCTHTRFDTYDTQAAEEPPSLYTNTVHYQYFTYYHDLWVVVYLNVDLYEIQILFEEDIV